jgi:hypothetical protein
VVVSKYIWSTRVRASRSWVSGGASTVRSHRGSAGPRYRCHCTQVRPPAYLVVVSIRGSLPVSCRERFLPVPIHALERWGVRGGTAVVPRYGHAPFSPCWNLNGGRVSQCTPDSGWPTESTAMPGWSGSLLVVELEPCGGRLVPWCGTSAAWCRVSADIGAWRSGGARRSPQVLCFF